MNFPIFFIILQCLGNFGQTLVWRRLSEILNQPLDISIQMYSVQEKHYENTTGANVLVLISSMCIEQRSTVGKNFEELSIKVYKALSLCPLFRKHLFESKVRMLIQRSKYIYFF